MFDMASLIEAHDVIGTGSVHTTQDKLDDPTAETYQALISAFEFFNATLFGEQLPRPVFTLQRHRGAYGFFAGDCFERPDGSEKRSEIALNPSYLRSRSAKEVLSTVVHEMAHLAQHHDPKLFGTPGKRGYHGASFARTMEQIGLITSSTGLPGGARTGVRISHYVESGGLFDQKCGDLLQLGFYIPFVEQFGKKRDLPPGSDDDEEREKKNASKTKYSCPSCDLNVWGKPNLHVTCGDHQTRLIAAMP